MQPFRYVKAASLNEAIRLVSNEENALYLAGGTTLVNQLRSSQRRPRLVVDITGLPLTGLEVRPQSLRFGALERGLTRDERVVGGYTLLSQALLAGASPQIRNRATPGSNLLQGLRTPFFHETGVLGGQGAVVSSGTQASMGYALGPIFGDGNAVYGSDFGVALTALEGVVHAQGSNGEKTIPIGEFYLSPKDDREAVTALERADLITALEVPASPRTRVTYLKVRDRASFAYMIVSVAVALEMAGDEVRSARVALGGVAPVPYRATAVEAALVGQALTPEVTGQVSALATQGATPKPQAAYKVELLQHAVARALQTAGGTL